MPGFMVWFLAGAADPDRRRKRGAIAGDGNRLKTNFDCVMIPWGDGAFLIPRSITTLIAIAVDPLGRTDYQVRPPRH